MAGVTGADSGIRAYNYGTGALSITARGAVTANGLYGYGADGIRARNSGTDLTINAAAVSGARSGIDARNAGSGALSITASGPVVGAGVDGSEGGGDGIFATNAGTGLTINAAGVRGAHSGIVAFNDGSGALSITASEAVIGEGAVDGSEGGIGGDGIYASNEGTNLTVTAAAVTGAFSGIVALNDGSGSLSITHERRGDRSGNSRRVIMEDTEPGETASSPATAARLAFDHIHRYGDRGERNRHRRR